MNKTNLIITSGSSQLLTQIAALEEIGELNSNNFLIYNGLYRDSLDVFFKLVSKRYGLSYLGQISFNINPIKAKKKEFLKQLLSKSNKIFEGEIENQFPLLKGFKDCELLIIPVRIKVFSDILLANYINAKKTIYTADGIIDELPRRKFDNIGYNYLKSSLKSLPLQEYIYSPFFLKNDIESVGWFKKINLEKVLNNLSSIDLVTELRDKYFTNKISYVIISQHYHLHEDVSFDNDLKFYESIVNNINQNLGDGYILFKPHPRDTLDKINALKKLNLSNLKIVEEKFQSVPIEFFRKEIIEMKTVIISGNSSAPLFFVNTNKILSFKSEKLLSKKLNDKILEFVIKYNIELIELN